MIPERLRCADAQPLADETVGSLVGADGSANGFTQCAGGWIFRSEVRECASFAPRAELVDTTPNATITCTADSECRDRLHGYCSLVTSPVGYAGAHTACNYGCVRDEECAPNQVCLCGYPVGQCVNASCKSDADCPGFKCASSPFGVCGVVPGDFTCQSPADECMDYGGCGDLERCVTGAPGPRECQPSGVCGRPFLVFGIPRQAELAEVPSGWSSRRLETGVLDPQTRELLCAHWTRNALLEHASIAAFARFSLELLALGAPAMLLSASQQAQGDEIAHAELCFALASAYAGRPIEPGPLPIHGALDQSSFLDIVRTAVAEGCIGETLAAVEAAEAAAHAVDPDVRAILTRIAGDEARHAELAWHFLRWALEIAAPPARERLIDELVDAVLAEHAKQRPPHATDETSLLEHGVLTAELLHEVRRLALTELVLPTARALRARFCARTEPAALYVA